MTLCSFEDLNNVINLCDHCFFTHQLGRLVESCLIFLVHLNLNLNYSFLLLGLRKVNCTMNLVLL